MKSSRGFTLIEVLVSVSLLTMGFSSLWYFFKVNANQIIQAEQKVKTCYLLQEEAENLLYRDPVELEDSLYIITEDSIPYTISRSVYDQDKKQFLKSSRTHASLLGETKETLPEIELILYKGHLSEIKPGLQDTLCRLSFLKDLQPWF